MPNTQFKNTPEFKEKIYKIYTTVMSLINNRYGIDTESYEIDYRKFDSNINDFVSNLNTTKPPPDGVFDTIINNNEHNDSSTLVKYIKSKITDSNIKKIIANLRKKFSFDDLVLIFFDEKSDDIKKLNRLAIEKKYSSHNVRIFMYDELLFDITQHILVPKHCKYTDDTSELIKKLMIDNESKLPFILYNDPISRFYGLKENDIVEIERNELSQNNKSFRVCKYN
tara:strand:+ start:267 stop:941 length:675 start_codon:yes stop_codon:yes gene_type:complete